MKKENQMSKYIEAFTKILKAGCWYEFCSPEQDDCVVACELCPFNSDKNMDVLIAELDSIR